MVRSLDGKLAVVTGASRGIGAAIAINLASKGVNLIINYISDSSAQLAADLAHSLQTTHDIRAVPVQADVGTPEGAQKLLADTKSAFLKNNSRTLQIDILINNAGVAMNATIPNIQTSHFHDNYRVNVLGPLLVVQALSPYLPTDRSGRIVNISSVSSTAGFIGQSVYGGTKAALEAMTRTWARELAERATVNAVNPGPVEGPMYASNSPEFLEGIRGWIMHTPLMRPRGEMDGEEVVKAARADGSGGRPAYTKEVAGIVGMLCGEEAGWCTGQVVCANGGMLMLH